jgi:hypothetical protein
MSLSSKKLGTGSVGRAAARSGNVSGARQRGSVVRAASSTIVGAADADTSTTTTLVPGASDQPKSAVGPVLRTASLEALMADAEALVDLDVAELMRQEEMLATMREQVARALAMKRAGSVAPN